MTRSRLLFVLAAGCLLAAPGCKKAFDADPEKYLAGD